MCLLEGSKTENQINRKLDLCSVEEGKPNTIICIKFIFWICSCLCEIFAVLILTLGQECGSILSYEAIREIPSILWTFSIWAMADNSKGPERVNRPHL